MSQLRSLCVFCGHASGSNPAYLTAASALGHYLATSGVELIYGGGRVGMMGALAEATLSSNGRVVSIIPDFLVRTESIYMEASEIIIVESMEARKRMMLDRAEAFCVLPGGFGTMDEAFEVITQKQLGLLPKPIVLADIDGFFQPWKAMINSIINGGYAMADTSQLYQIVPSVKDVIPAVELAFTNRQSL